jgi:hypothetical protein
VQIYCRQSPGANLINPAGMSPLHNTIFYDV